MTYFDRPRGPYGAMQLPLVVKWYQDFNDKSDDVSLVTEVRLGDLVLDMHREPWTGRDVEEIIDETINRFAARLARTLDDDYDKRITDLEQFQAEQERKNYDAWSTAKGADL